VTEKNIPEKIRNTLTQEEVIEHSFRLVRTRVYITNKRLFELKWGTVRDYDYSNISGITYATKRYWITLIAGLICIGISILFKPEISDMLFWTGIGLGGLMAATGLLVKPEWLEITVIGLSKPVIFQGPRGRLDSIMEIIRAKQPSAQSVATIDPESI
jgi:hypothetical protein